MRKYLSLLIVASLVSLTAAYTQSKWGVSAGAGVANSAAMNNLGMIGGGDYENGYTYFAGLNRLSNNTKWQYGISFLACYSSGTREASMPPF